jgi:hypothetical protein
VLWAYAPSGARPQHLSLLARCARRRLALRGLRPLPRLRGKTWTPMIDLEFVECDCVDAVPNRVARGCRRRRYSWACGPRSLAYRLTDCVLRRSLGKPDLRSCTPGGSRSRYLRVVVDRKFGPSCDAVVKRGVKEVASIATLGEHCGRIAGMGWSTLAGRSWPARAAPAGLTSSAPEKILFTPRARGFDSNWVGKTSRVACGVTNSVTASNASKIRYFQQGGDCDPSVTRTGAGCAKTLLLRGFRRRLVAP